jgi:indoleacetamide hydrolase
MTTQRNRNETSMHDGTLSAGEVSTGNDSELTELGVVAAAAAIQRGDITSESYSAALLRRARSSADLHSFITIDEAALLTAACEADKARAAGSSAPLLGVPLGIKDSYKTQGLRTTLGLKALRDFVPDQDAEIVSTIKAAGGIVFGKNNLVEMSYGVTGHNREYGQVKNPYGRNHVSGGSSSGSAASVAGRIVPASLGGDTVGSIRIPASFNGVVGYKPTTGRWPGSGVAPISHVLDTTGLFARNVEDCILLDQIVTKRAVATESEPTDLRGARFAYAPKHYLELIDPETEAHFHAAVLRLRDAGAEVVEIDLGEDFSALADRMTWSIFLSETQRAITEFLHKNDFPVSFDEVYNGLKPRLKEAWSATLFPGGPAYVTEDEYSAAISVDRPELQRRLGDVFAKDGFNALIFPTTPTPAPTFADQWEFEVAGETVADLFLAKNTVPASGAGIPGISLPVGLTGNGLPIGIELNGAHGRDQELLDLARSVESVFGFLPAPA